METTITAITILISLTAVTISIISLVLNKKAKNSEIKRALQVQADNINDAFVRHDVRSPYESFLNIPELDSQEARAKIILMFLQLNLLRNVFNNNNGLSKSFVDNYRRWASKILRPWIEQDHHLRTAYHLWVSSEGGGKEYTKWLIEIMPILGKNPLR